MVLEDITTILIQDSLYFGVQILDLGNTISTKKLAKKKKYVDIPNVWIVMKIKNL